MSTRFSADSSAEIWPHLNVLDDGIVKRYVNAAARDADPNRAVIAVIGSGAAMVVTVWGGSAWVVLSSQWIAYTPAIGGFTLGNGTVTGRWIQIAKHVTVEVLITLGTTSVVSDLYIPLPMTANRNQRIGTGWVSPSPSGAAFSAFAFATANPNQVLVRCPNSSQSFQALSPTFPAAWSAGGQIFTQITYEAA